MSCSWSLCPCVRKNYVLVTRPVSRSSMKSSPRQQQSHVQLRVKHVPHTQKSIFTSEVFRHFTWSFLQMKHQTLVTWYSAHGVADPRMRCDVRVRKQLPHNNNKLKHKMMDNKIILCLPVFLSHKCQWQVLTRPVMILNDRVKQQINHKNNNNFYLNLNASTDHLLHNCDDEFDRCFHTLTAAILIFKLWWHLIATFSSLFMFESKSKKQRNDIICHKSTTGDHRHSYFIIIIIHDSNHNEQHVTVTKLLSMTSFSKQIRIHKPVFDVWNFFPCCWPTNWWSIRMEIAF